MTATHSHLMVNDDVVSCAYSCSSNQKPVAPLEFSQSSVLFSNSADNATLLGKQWLHKLSKLGAIADVANASNGKMKSSNAPDVNFCDWACICVQSAQQQFWLVRLKVQRETQSSRRCVYRASLRNALCRGVWILTHWSVVERDSAHVYYRAHF